MLEDAVRQYVVKGTKTRVNLKPNAERDRYGKHAQAIPSDVINRKTPEGQEIYHLCKLLNQDIEFVFVTVVKFVEHIQCEPHTDDNNKGMSRIIMFGDLVGGSLEAS